MVSSAKTNNKSSFNLFGVNRILIVLLVLLIVTLVVIGTKYMAARVLWRMYSMQMQERVMQLPSRDAQEDAQILAMSISNNSSQQIPLFQDPRDLQAFISKIGQITGRDIVVVDNKKNIIADVIPANIGKKYMADKGSEVFTTIQDGTTRTFTEQSNDYPQGITAAVVPVRDVDAKIVGALILSSSNIFK